MFSFLCAGGTIHLAMLSFCFMVLSHAQSTSGLCAVTGGDSYRWPAENPSLLAPVTAVFSYSRYTSPLAVVNNGAAIVVQMPGDYVGGFVLDTGNGTQGEAYKLVRIELRKPGRAPPGQSQQLSHILEAALVHQEVNGDRWANVNIGFDVSPSNLSADILSPLVSHTVLPNHRNQKGQVLAQSGMVLDLNNLFYNAEFLHFWEKLPTTCPGTSVHARYLMRSAAVPTSAAAYSQLLAALELAPEEAPMKPKDVAWRVPACASGDKCAAKTATNLKSELPKLLQIQSTAVSELRERKQLLDKALWALTNGTQGAYQVAASARDDLRSAESELVSIKQKVDKIDAQIKAAGVSVWDSDAPPRQNTVPASKTADSAKATNSTNLLATISRVDDASMDRCDAFGLSPIDVDSAAVTDPAKVSPQLVQVLELHNVGGTTGIEPVASTWTLSNLGNRIRLYATEGSGNRLGSLVLGGMERDISYVDIRVPSEHTVDGRSSAMELQLFHTPLDDRPTIAVSLLFDVAEGPNKWLQPISDAIPSLDMKRETQGLWLNQIHHALTGASTTQYYHYDGTLTSPPCRQASWFVLREAGHIGVDQLAAFKHALQSAQIGGRPRFKPAFVTLGTEHLVSEVGLKGLTGAFGPEGRSALRSKRRVQM